MLPVWVLFLLWAEALSTTGRVYWKASPASQPGIRKIEGVDLKDIPVTIAGQVPWGKGEHEFDPDSVFAPKDQKKNDKFIMYGMAAGADALTDAGWDVETASDEEKDRFGVMMGMPFLFMKTA